MSPRPLILDGITIQLAGELLFDVGTNPEDRKLSSHLYRNALWDLGYAVLFGDSLRWVGSLGERNGASPGQELIKFDAGAVFQDKLPSGAGSVEDILVQDELVKTDIKMQLGKLHEIFGQNSKLASIWKEYILLEAATNLTEEPVSSASPVLGAQYDFPGRKGFVYLTNHDLQRTIDDKFVNNLVSAITHNMPGRKQDDLNEFVRRVLLNHYTISAWYEKGAASADFIRMPFGTRSAVRYSTALSNFVPQNSAEKFHKARAAKIRLSTTAMSEVLARYGSPKREDIYSALVDSREKYVNHRNCLAAIDFFSTPENYSPKELEDARLELERQL